MKGVWVVAAAMLAVVVSACVGQEPTSRLTGREAWDARVQVQGSTARVTVEVSGLLMGRDYHPHLYLDDGPEIMMFTSPYSFSRLSEGRHQLRVAIADSAHRNIPGMEKVIEFEVEGSGG